MVQYSYISIFITPRIKKPNLYPQQLGRNVFAQVETYIVLSSATAASIMEAKIIVPLLLFTGDT